jgi:basic membrane protein A
MKLTRRTLTAAALAAGLVAGTAGAQDDPFTVGFVYVGPIGDYGWTWTHDQGRLAVEEAFGDAVETVYAESVPEGADSERVITQMILQGADMIFTTSFGLWRGHERRRGQLPRRLFRARHGLPARASQRLDLLRPLLRGPRGDRPYRRSHDGIEHHRLHRDPTRSPK